MYISDVVQNRKQRNGRLEIIRNNQELLQTHDTPLLDAKSEGHLEA